MFSLHLTFSDGSNPWVRFGMTPKEFGKELIRWSKNFTLVFDKVLSEEGVSCIVMMTAKKKEGNE